MADVGANGRDGKGLTALEKNAFTVGEHPRAWWSQTKGYIVWVKQETYNQTGTVYSMVWMRVNDKEIIDELPPDAAELIPLEPWRRWSDEEAVAARAALRDKILNPPRVRRDLLDGFYEHDEDPDQLALAFDLGEKVVSEKPPEGS